MDRTYQHKALRRVTLLRTDLIVIAITAIALIGCNGESDSELTTVSPPPISTGTNAGLNTEDPTVDSDTPKSDPPGGMELPQGDIPNGDSPPSPADDSAGSGGLEMPRASSGQPTASSVKVQYASWPDVERLGKSSGKLTVIDVWSSACGPCIKELPGLAKIHKSMGSKVQCVSMNIDFDGRRSRPPETYESEATDILTGAGATFTNFICTTASDDVFAAAGIASIPAVLVYDKEGNLVKKFVDIGSGAGFTYDKDIIPLVAAQLQ